MKLKPTTTSYAILGLLSVRPWSAYELAQQMSRSLIHCWPVAPSVVYHEPKRLVATGYATVTRQQAGRRSRAVYQITPGGRDALRQWLATQPADPQLQMEPMLRLIFADSATPRELAASLRGLRAWADCRRAAAPASARTISPPEDLSPAGSTSSPCSPSSSASSTPSCLRLRAQRAEDDVTRWLKATTTTGLSPHTRKRLQAVVDLARRRGLTDAEHQTPSTSP